MAPSKYREYASSLFRTSKFRETETAKPQVELELEVPPRTAARIVRLAVH